VGVVARTGAQCASAWRAVRSSRSAAPVAMPNIVNEVKLDFKDVLLRPKRSTLRSRNDVSLYFIYLHCTPQLGYFRTNKTRITIQLGLFALSGRPVPRNYVPQLEADVQRDPRDGQQHGHHRHVRDGQSALQGIVNLLHVYQLMELAGPDDRTTLDILYVVFNCFAFQHGLFTTVHKYYSVEEWKKFTDENPDCVKNMGENNPIYEQIIRRRTLYMMHRFSAASSGTGKGDFERLSDILTAVPSISFICLDVANGYSQHFVEYVRKVRSAFPDHTIIAGNVVTGEMVEELILSGADIIKVSDRSLAVDVGVDCHFYLLSSFRF
jgi:hypothetical protein